MNTPNPVPTPTLLAILAVGVLGGVACATGGAGTRAEEDGPSPEERAFLSERVLFSPGDIVVLDIDPSINLTSVSVRSVGR